MDMILRELPLRPGPFFNTKITSNAEDETVCVVIVANKRNLKDHRRELAGSEPIVKTLRISMTTLIKSGGISITVRTVIA